MKQLQNNFTTPKQSSRLLELGVPADSADMHYHQECIRMEHGKVTRLSLLTIINKLTNNNKTMKTLGIILLVVAGLSFILCILSTIDGDADSVFDFTLILGCSTAILGAIMVSKADIPTDKDVFNGKAEYQETVHITGTDTIKTYQIVWKQNN